MKALHTSITLFLSLSLISATACTASPEESNEGSLEGLARSGVRRVNSERVSSEIRDSLSSERFVVLKKGSGNAGALQETEIRLSGKSGRTMRLRVAYQSTVSEAEAIVTARNMVERVDDYATTAESFQGSNAAAGSIFQVSAIGPLIYFLLGLVTGGTVAGLIGWFHEEIEQAINEAGNQTSAAINDQNERWNSSVDSVRQYWADVATNKCLPFVLEYRTANTPPGTWDRFAIIVGPGCK